MPIQPLHALSSILSKYVGISYNNRMKLIAWLHDEEHTVPALIKSLYGGEKLIKALRLWFELDDS